MPQSTIFMKEELMLTVQVSPSCRGREDEHVFIHDIGSFYILLLKACEGGNEKPMN